MSGIHTSPATTGPVGTLGLPRLAGTLVAWTLGCVLGLGSLVAWAGELDGQTQDRGWIDLSGLDSWKKPTGDWMNAADSKLDESNPKMLKAIDGTAPGILINGPSGRTRNLVSNRQFSDVEVHLEFMVPKGSNSGIKLQTVYEIQLFDSYGVKKIDATHCGGIYPRAELLPKYHHIDDGYPPKLNASKPAGEWQTLDIVFRSPKFDDRGKKTANATFVKVLLNGQLIHENVDIPCPTGHVWRLAEKPSGPILLQADHGPVAFRNIKVRPLDDSASKPKSDTP